MKTQIKNNQSLSLVAALALVAFTSVTSAFAQGALTPPGAPAPTMKSLDQVEARTPLEAGQPGVNSLGNGNYVITASGSYYLTRNLVFTNSANHGINLGSQDVTLDLNGFSLQATDTNGSKAIISISGVAGQKVTIRNGNITGSGTNLTGYYGITIISSTLGSVLVEDVHCYNLYAGIFLNEGTGRNIVRNCSVEKVYHTGIAAEVVTGCTVVNSANYAIKGNSVSDCVVTTDASVPNTASGIRALTVNSTCVVQNCNVVARAIGIVATTVINSYASSVNSTAIVADVANNCTASRPSGTAIDATVANGCYALSGTNIINFKYNMP